MLIDGYIEQKELEHIVDLKLKEIGIGRNDYPIDPFKLIREENIILCEKPFDNANIKGMIVHGENFSGIMINSNRCYASRRFIAMHELCHFWFHPHKSKRICLNEYKKEMRGIEWQANNAAAYALMPANILTDLFLKTNGNIEFISNYFLVSPECLNYRIKELNIKQNLKSITSFKDYIPFNYSVENEIDLDCLCGF